MPPSQNRLPVKRRANYDAFLYSNYPYAETHPDRLCAIAHLFGVKSAHPERAKVLELGCGLGGNLIAMAVLYPDARFTGIDRSVEQIAVARKWAEELALKNIEFHAMDIRDFARKAKDRPYDYVLCHGVYSWVPKEVQKQILRVIHTRMAKTGVAYISYNTLPGWHMRGMVRDMLLRHVGKEGSTAERIGRAHGLLRFLSQERRERSTAESFLMREVELLGRLGDRYLYYEHLVDHNQPQYFLDFIEDVQSQGLGYLADAGLAGILPNRLSIDLSALSLPEEDYLQVEEAMDYLHVRFFRRSLLLHEGVQVNRDVKWQSLRGLHVGAHLAPSKPDPDLRPGVPVEFRASEHVAITTEVPLLKAAMLLLHEERPGFIEFQDLCKGARERLADKNRRRDLEAGERIGDNLLDMLTMGYLELCMGTVPMALVPGKKPLTTTLCRLQASRGETACTNLRHESVHMDDLDRALLKRMDGQHTVDQLIAEVVRDVKEDVFSLEVEGRTVTDRRGITPIVKRVLERLARSALLLS